MSVFGSGRTVADVAVDMTVECMDDRGVRHQLDVVLGYRRTDPYAVTMTFLTGTGDLEAAATGLRATAGVERVDVDRHTLQLTCRDAPALVSAIVTTATTLITTNDPVRIAEEYAMLQHLSKGRMDLMLGRGNTAPGGVFGPVIVLDDEVDTRRHGT